MALMIQATPRCFNHQADHPSQPSHPLFEVSATPSPSCGMDEKGVSRVVWSRFQEGPASLGGFWGRGEVGEASQTTQIHTNRGIFPVWWF